MTDETRLRFLTSIAKQIQVERVAEVHLFGAIRQGGVESGVAVIALEREMPVTLDVDGGYVPPLAVAEAAAVESDADVVVHDQLEDESAYAADEVLVEADPSPVAQDDSDAPEQTADVVVLSEAKDLLSASPKAPSRFTIYSARYRHTLKGPDRGKWEVSVTEEADAPLITVDAVVRGVQRRSGDVDEIVRIDGSEFRALLPTAAA